MAVRRVISTFAAGWAVGVDGGTHYTSPVSPRNWSTGQTSAETRWLAASIFRGLDIELDTAPGTGKSWTFDLLVDGVATDASVTISGSSTRGVLDAAVVATIPRDSLIVLRRTASGTPAAVTTVRYNAIVDGTETRISCYGGYPGATGTGVGVCAHLLNPGRWYGTVLGYIHDVLPVDLTVEEWAVHLSSAPGVGASRTFTVRSAQPVLPLTFGDAFAITISGTETEGSASPDVTFPAGTLLQVIETESGAPVGAHGTWCVRCQIAGADGQSIMATSHDPVFEDDSTRWYGPNGTDESGASEAAAALTVRAAFDLQALYVKQFDGTPDGTQLFVTTRKNAADTDLEVILAGSGLDGEYGFEEAGAASFVAGDTFDVQMANGGAPVSFGHVGVWAWLQVALAEAVDDIPISTPPAGAGVIGPRLWIIFRRTQPESAT
jgi:hypothetical protein